MRQHADRAAPGGVLLATSRPFQNLRTLVFGHHALNLQEQIVLRTLGELSVEKDHLDAAVLQLVDQKNLIRVAPGQTVRRMHVQSRERAGGGLVAQAVQRRTNQGAAAVAIVHEGQLGIERATLFADAHTKGLQLALDRPIAGLPLAGHAGIDRHTSGCIYVVHEPTFRAGVDTRFRRAVGDEKGPGSATRAIGITRSYVDARSNLPSRENSLARTMCQRGVR
jgi:hypothetical protein